MSSVGLSRLRQLEIPFTVIIVLLVVIPTIILFAIDNKHKPLVCGDKTDAVTSVQKEGTSKSSTLTEDKQKPPPLCGDLCKSKFCIRKCCLKNESFRSNEEKTCTTQENLKFPMNISVFDDNLRLKKVPNDYFNVIYGDPCFTWGPLAILNDSLLLQNGTVLAQNGITRSVENYCLERFGAQDDYYTFVCAPAPRDPLYNVTTATYVVSSVLYLAVLIVFFMERTMRQGFYGKASLCFLICMTCAVLAATALRRVSGADTYAKQVVYAIASIVEVYTLLVGLTWLALMIFPVWTRARSLKPIIPDEPEVEPFLWHFAFAWGFNLAYLAICAGILVVIELDYYVVMVFIPVEVILIVSSMMAVTTVYRLRVYDSSAPSQQNSWVSPDDRKRFKMSLKLLVVVVVTWLLLFIVAEIILTLRSPHFDLATGIFGVLQAVGSSTVLVGNRRVKEVVRQRFQLPV